MRAWARRTASVAVGLAVALSAVGCGGGTRTADRTAAAVAPSAPAGAGPDAAPAPLVHPSGFASVRRLATVAAPDRLRIPSIGVDTSLDRLERQADGSLQVPPQWLVAGWYQQGPAPGQPGPAAILGHVDSPSGPAVFALLRTLQVGDAVLVDAGQRTLRFRVTGQTEVPKDHFPSEEVYLPTLEPVLRLITCGGTFDRSTGHYRDNVIVSAALE